MPLTYPTKIHTIFNDKKLTSVTTQYNRCDLIIFEQSNINT